MADGRTPYPQGILARLPDQVSAFDDVLAANADSVTGRGTVPPQVRAVDPRTDSDWLELSRPGRQPVHLATLDRGGLRHLRVRPHRAGPRRSRRAIAGRPDLGRRSRPAGGPAPGAAVLRPRRAHRGRRGRVDHRGLGRAGRGPALHAPLPGWLTRGGRPAADQDRRGGVAPHTDQSGAGPIARRLPSADPAQHRQGGPLRRPGGVARRRRGGVVLHSLHVGLRKRKYRLLAQPRDFFYRAWKAFAPDDAVRTGVASVDGVPVAAAMYLVWQDTVYYKFGASRADSLAVRPNDALHWQLIRWAAGRGLRVLDWGLSDLDQPGLVAYKRNWASEEGRIATLNAGGGPLGRRTDVEDMLREMTALLTEPDVPDPVAERGGAALYRYFC
ncbi:MAG: GNAT family N-acetyltransferase [Actinomycetota bacterium]|nr:GNAT family N-acetyltransferase [Actinomycetota bacterium]